MNVRNSKKKSDKNSYLQTGSNELYKKIHFYIYLAHKRMYILYSVNLFNVWHAGVAYVQ